MKDKGHQCGSYEDINPEKGGVKINKGYTERTLGAIGHPYKLNETFSLIRTR